MKRPYLALATIALVAGLTPLPSFRAGATGLFGSAPVEPASFAVLARPVGDDDWSLVVLEQLRARPFCWTPRPDGLVDPSLNRFDYTGICGRFIDSNGYSLRVGDVDLNHTYRLRVQRSGNELRLLATTASRGAELVVGRGTVPRRDRDLFVSLQLEPGWELRRRVFGERSLNHVYFANGQSIDNLIATSRGRAIEERAPLADGPLLSPEAPPPVAVSRRERSERPRRGEPAGGRAVDSQARLDQEGLPAAPSSASPSHPSPVGNGAPEGGGSGVVALQVIPYQERQQQAGGADGRSLPSGDSLSASQGQ
jgi:hypothetical protein